MIDKNMKWKIKIGKTLGDSKVILHVGGKDWEIPVTAIECQTHEDDLSEMNLNIFLHEGNCEMVIR